MSKARQGGRVGADFTRAANHAKHGGQRVSGRLGRTRRIRGERRRTQWKAVATDVEVQFPCEVNGAKNALRFDKRPYNVLELEEATCVSGGIAHSPLEYAVGT